MKEAKRIKRDKKEKTIETLFLFPKNLIRYGEASWVNADTVITPEYNPITKLFAPKSNSIGITKLLLMSTVMDWLKIPSIFKYPNPLSIRESLTVSSSSPNAINNPL